jgi:hypothetical protein
MDTGVACDDLASRRARRMTDQEWRDELRGVLEGTGWCVDDATVGPGQRYASAQLRHEHTGDIEVFKLAATRFATPETRAAEIRRRIEKR